MTKSIFVLLLLVATSGSANCQIRMGTSPSEINFRESAGLNSKVLFTVGSSNLLVILPAESQNGFVEVFDIETSSFGYVYESLIQITDTLYFQEKHFFEKTDSTNSGSIDIELINHTDKRLFIWINKTAYNLDPREKKYLIMPDEEIVYFSSTPGVYPVFGREMLRRGFIYRLNFTL